MSSDLILDLANALVAELEENYLAEDLYICQVHLILLRRALEELGPIRGKHVKDLIVKIERAMYVRLQ